MPSNARIPELDPAQRREASKLFRRRVGWKYTVLFVTGLVVGAVLVQLYGSFAVRALAPNPIAVGLGRAFTTIAGGIGMGAALMWCLRARYRAQWAECVREVLRDQCPACGYDLSNLAGHRRTCPECGFENCRRPGPASSQMNAPS